MIDERWANASGGELSLDRYSAALPKKYLAARSHFFPLIYRHRVDSEAHQIRFLIKWRRF